MRICQSEEIFYHARISPSELRSELPQGRPDPLWRFGHRQDHPGSSAYIIHRGDHICRYSSAHPPSGTMYPWYVIYIPQWCSHEGCRKIHAKYPKPDMKLDLISNEIEANCADSFVEAFLNQYKEIQTKKPVILLEGYTVGLPKIHACLLKRLRSRGYRVWNMLSR